MARKSKSKEITCGLIRKADIDAVFELYNDSFHYSQKEHIAKRVQGRNHRACVAKDGNGKVVGFILYDMEVETGQKRLYVANVGVLAEAQRKGICGQMLTWVVARMPRYKVKEAYLYVDNSNKGAQKCYKRVGFRTKEGHMVLTLPQEGSRKPRKRKAA
jgi:ribosomal protein S18 acetylase RimI-like enzyme